MLITDYFMEHNSGVDDNGMKLNDGYIKFRQHGGLWVVLLLGIVFCCWFPLIRYPDKCGSLGDWDMFLAFYEAGRKTIVEYGQFPYWNPWHFGGVPLFANPQLSILGIETPFIVFFGTYYGLRLAMIFYVLAGAFGMWLLLGDYAVNHVSRFWGSLVFSLSGPLALHMAAGHPVMVTIVFLPWLLYFLRRLKDSENGALLFGFTAGMLVNHSLHYVSLVVTSFIGIYFAVELIKNIRSRQFLFHAALAGLMFLAVGAYRTIVTLQLLSEFPRAMDLRLDIGLHHYLLSLIYPGQSLFTFPKVQFCWNWFEVGCYVGVVAMVMFIISAVKAFKWWHWGFVLASLLSINSTCQYLPGYWLRDVPPFTSFFCITRWRFLVVFFIAIGCCAGFDWLYEKFKERGARIRLLILIALSISGLIYNQYVNWQGVTWVTEDSLMKTVPVSSETIITAQEHEKYSLYASTHKGVAQLFAYEPLLGYEKQYRNQRIPVGSKYYKGEFFAYKGALTDILWTPGLFELTCAAGSSIVINQNVSSYWRGADGKQIYPNSKSFDVDKFFVMDTAEPGKILVYARPPLHGFAMAVSLAAAGVLIGLGTVRYLQRRGKTVK
ncbi:MAG: hypothetical protein WCI51_17830 [Lentisphaerota bacterium]